MRAPHLRARDAGVAAMCRRRAGRPRRAPNPGFVAEKRRYSLLGPLPSGEAHGHRAGPPHHARSERWLGNRHRGKDSTATNKAPFLPRVRPSATGSDFRQSRGHHVDQDQVTQYVTENLRGGRLCDCLQIEKLCVQVIDCECCLRRRLHRAVGYECTGKGAEDTWA